MIDAERAGGVLIKRYKRFEMRHLVERIALDDPMKLYHFLGRVPLAEIVDAVVSRLQGELPDLHADAARCLVHFVTDWKSGRQPFGLSPSAEEAGRFLRSLDAVLRRPSDDQRDLRTFSAQSLGNSKLLEEQRWRILAWLAGLGRIPRDLDEEDAAAAAGLEKFEHPVLVAGSIRLNGRNLADLTYLGIAPEDVGRLGPSSDLQAVLTVENFASFNRYVREALQPGEGVIYTAGFPTRAVLAVVSRLTSMSGARLWHWGDIDAGGVRIAEHIAQRIDRSLRLHLMEPSRAVAMGRPASAVPGLAALGGSPQVRCLATFLAAEGAAHLEQELVDPTPVLV
jgi:hypothetical protein